MGKSILPLLIIYLFFYGPLCLAQTSIKVSDPRLELRDNILHITYDILNSHPSDEIDISVLIRDEDGDEIDAKSFDGDIGVIKDGGYNMHIAWDLGKDQIIMDADIFINVIAEIIVSEYSIKNSEMETRSEDIRDTPSYNDAEKSYSRGGVILLSLALPGLGLSRVTGNPHWIRGVVGYGSIAGAIVLNKQAIKTYDSFTNAKSIESANSLLAESTSQDNLSEALAYTAAGIWVLDIIWNLIGTSDLMNSYRRGVERGISINTSIEPSLNIPLVGINYRF